MLLNNFSLSPSLPCQSPAKDLLASDIFAPAVSEPSGQISPTGQAATTLQTNPLDLFKTSAAVPVGSIAGIGRYLKRISSFSLLP